MNKVILIGHLCADPDVRYSQGENSMAVARYRLAVDRRYKREDEQKREAMEKEVDDYRKKSMDVSDIVDSRIKAIAERDVYKELYMKLLERAISA